MIVPDASATALLFGDPEQDDRVLEARRRLRADPEWVVPAHWRTEVASALRGLYLSEKIEEDTAARAVDWLRRATVAVAPTAPYLARMWDLRDSLSTYDAGYVAVAEAHDVTLVTGDVKVERAGVARCPILVIR